MPVPPWRPSSPIYARRRSSLGLDDRQPLSSYPANSFGSRLNDFDGIDLAATTYEHCVAIGCFSLSHLGMKRQNVGGTANKIVGLFFRTEELINGPVKT